MTGDERIHEGGCACAAVRYRARGADSHAGFCHCTSCRRASGAPYVGWVTFPREGFAITAGQPVARRSSPAVVRQHCGRCGTALTYARDDEPESLDVTLASFDAPEAFTPRGHIWVSEKLPWVEIADGLPQLPRGFGED